MEGAAQPLLVPITAAPGRVVAAPGPGRCRRSVELTLELVQDPDHDVLQRLGQGET